MIESRKTINRTNICGSCGASVRGRRYLELESDGSDLVGFCSEVCLRAARTAQRRRRWRARRRAMKVAIIGVAVAGACLAPHQGKYAERAGQRPPSAAAPSRPRGRRRRRDGSGPSGRPTETSVLAALGRDTWVHPLAGPFRRMPRSDSRVFGAVRPGDRADRVPQRPLRRRSRRRDLGRARARRRTTASSTASSAARTRIAAASSCASPIATARCSRSTFTSRRSRAGSSAGTLVKGGRRHRAARRHRRQGVRAAPALRDVGATGGRTGRRVHRSRSR